ncbi:MAG: ATP-binding protein, partial [Verrucomicrobia bacterium]|nr:ATP-binding protein [Verrucomicrobiota bacterium]
MSAPAIITFPRSSNFSPFRGLKPFDLEHANFFYGRSKSVANLLAILKKQAAIKAPLAMIVGPSGSGKTSLACAGVLPALIQGLDGGEISWRFATVTPSSGGTSGSPFAGLASAILKKTAVPELAHSAYKGNWQSLEADLCNDPKRAIFRLSQTLQLLSFASSLGTKKDPLLLADKGSESENKQVRAPAKPVRLMLIVDQLEQLFTGGFSFDLQRRYLHLIADLAKSLQVYVIATLQSEFLDSFHEHLAAAQSIFLSGIYELHAPSQQELTEILHLSA